MYMYIISLTADHLKGDFVISLYIPLYYQSAILNLL